MAWKVVSPEQLAALPSYQSLTLLPQVRYGEGYRDYTWSSPTPLSEEQKQRMKQEAETLIRQINGLAPDAPLIPPPLKEKADEGCTN
jgi:hypothetical protein